MKYSKRLIAYHEIGHAVIGTLLQDHDPVQKVTLIPREQARGPTWFTPVLCGHMKMDMPGRAGHAAQKESHGQGTRGKY